MNESNKVAKLPVETSAQDTMLALKNSVYPGAKDESIGLVLAYCRAAGLDPLQKPVHIVPMWDKNAGAMRDVIMPGIGLYRTQAARSGSYAGVTEPIYGDDVTEEIGGAQITFPKWCRVTVKRIVGGQIVEYTAKEFWKENYAMKGGKEKSVAPNAMWMKRPYGQIAKCAEAQALRKAFPEFGAQQTAEEMEGKVLDDATIIDGSTSEVLGMPSSKSGNPKGLTHTEKSSEAAGIPAGPGPLKLIRAKLTGAEITEAECCEKFGLDKLESLTMDRINDVFAWIANPGE